MTLCTLLSVLASLVFLVANGVILLAILRSNREAGRKAADKTAKTDSQTGGADQTVQGEQAATAAETDQTAKGEKALAAADILGWEFEYARVTASEANAERHTMVNIYLLITGVAASGVAAVLGGDADLPAGTGTVLLWLLCGVGWLYFLAIVRLRQAWYGSAQAMNRIKGFYIKHSREFDSSVLCSAFSWQADTLPAPDKPWTVYFYSAMLIGLLNSTAYVVGGVLIAQQAIKSAALPVVGVLVLCGLAFFAFHVWLYFAFLKPDPPREAKNVC